MKLKIPPVPFLLVTCFMVLYTFTRQTFVPLLDAIKLEGFYGTTFFSGAKIASNFALVYAALQIPYGNMIDKIGLKKTMIILSLFMGSGFLVCAASHSLLTFGIGRIITALGCAGAFIAMVKATEIEFGNDSIAKVVGVLVAVALSLGLLFIKFGSPMLANGDNRWRIMYGIKGVLSLLIFFYFQFFSKNKAFEPSTVIKKQISFLEFFGMIVKNSYILAILLFSLLFFMIFYGINETTFIAVVYEKLGITKNNTYSVLLFGYLIGFLTVPSVAKSVGEIKTCISMSLVLIALSAGMFFYPSKILAYIFALIVGYSNGLQMTAVEMATTDLPNLVKGKSTGLMNVLFVGGVFLAQNILFYLVPKLSMKENTIFIFTATCALLSIFTLFAIGILGKKKNTNI